MKTDSAKAQELLEQFAARAESDADAAYAHYRFILNRADEVLYERFKRDEEWQ